MIKNFQPHGLLLPPPGSRESETLIIHPIITLFNVFTSPVHVDYMKDVKSWCFSISFSFAIYWLTYRVHEDAELLAHSELFQVFRLILGQIIFFLLFQN